VPVTISDVEDVLGPFAERTDFCAYKMDLAMQEGFGYMM
jgi:hypothetical protein